MLLDNYKFLIIRIHWGVTFKRYSLRIRFKTTTLLKIQRTTESKVYYHYISTVVTFEFNGEDETGDKYEQWNFQIENLFASDGLESVLDVSEGASDRSGENSANVFAKLAVSCTGKALREVRRVPEGNGRAAWRALRNRFACKREEPVVALSVEVLSLQREV